MHACSPPAWIVRESYRRLHSTQYDELVLVSYDTVCTYIVLAAIAAEAGGAVLWLREYLLDLCRRRHLSQASIVSMLSQGSAKGSIIAHGDDIALE